jgi:hypothetical protein
MKTNPSLFKRWAVPLLFVALGWGGCGSQTLDAAEEFSESFLNKRHNQAIMGVVGEARFLQPQEQGLQIHIKPPATDNTGIRYAPHLIGDFKVTVRASLVNVPKPSDGYGTGFTLLLEDGQSHGASLQRVVFPGQRQSVVSHHYTVVGGEHNHKAKETPMDAMDMILQVERKGSTLIYRASAKGTEALQEIDRVEFTSNPIVVTQVYGQPGGAANEVVVRIEGVEITAAELLRPGQKSKVADKGRYPAVIAIATAFAAVATGLFLLRRRRSGPAA